MGACANMMWSKQLTSHRVRPIREELGRLLAVHILLQLWGGSGFVEWVCVWGGASLGQAGSIRSITKLKACTHRCGLGAEAEARGWWRHVDAGVARCGLGLDCLLSRD